MRVLQLGPYPPPHGGIQTNIVLIRRYLLDREIPCAVINITRHRKPNGDDLYYPKSAAGLIRLLLTLDYDIIHLHFGGIITNRLLTLALICTLIPGNKVVLTLHSGGYPESEQGRNANPNTLQGFVFRRLDAIIGVNAAVIEVFRKLRVREQRLRLIEPHAASAVRPSDSISPEIKRFVESHRPLLTTVGLLEPEYDLSLQVGVLGRVLEQHANAGLLIIGSGSIADRLEREIARASYSHNVMLAGDVPHAETLRAIEERDLFLRTTLYDGDSLSVREALHLGVPVIATDNRMRPSGVVLVPRSDAEALRLAICDQLSRPATQRTRLCADEANLEAILGLYRDLIRE